MGSSRSTLDRFQQELLDAFFEREQRFFLTGGAALAGFHLGHRTTRDLDLFTVESVLEEGVTALREVARTLGASLESLRTAPEFHRFLITRGVTGRELQEYLYDLVLRLTRLAFPSE